MEQKGLGTILVLTFFALFSLAIPETGYTPTPGAIPTNPVVDTAAARKAQYDHCMNAIDIYKAQELAIYGPDFTGLQAYLDALQAKLAKVSTIVDFSSLTPAHFRDEFNKSVASQISYCQNEYL
jgi:hypothetical protein